MSQSLGGPELQYSHFSRSMAGISFPGRFSKTERLLQIQIAVPEELMEALGLRRVLVTAIRDAISLAGSRFRRAKIPYPRDEYLQQVDELEKRLGLAVLA